MVASPLARFPRGVLSPVSLAVLLASAACGTPRAPQPPTPARANANATVASSPSAAPTAAPSAAAPSPPPADAPRRVPPWYCTKRFPKGEFGEPRHAKNLSETGKLPKGRGARERWKTGMMGQPGVDRLGLTLPPFVSKERATLWTAYPESADVTWVAARRWPQPASSKRALWVVTVAGGSPLDVRFAVVDVDDATRADARVTPIAHSKAPLDPHADQTLIDQSGNDSAACDPTALLGSDAPGLRDAQSLEGLDVAPFDLADGVRAFGARTVETEGFSGGYASWETLSLFVVEGDAIVPVVDIPTSREQMIAGDWNPDHTRQHDYFESEVVVEVRPRAGTWADLVVHPPRRPASFITYRWDAARHAYVGD